MMDGLSVQNVLTGSTKKSDMESTFTCRLKEMGVHEHEGSDCELLTYGKYSSCTYCSWYQHKRAISAHKNILILNKQLEIKMGWQQRRDLKARIKTQKK